MKVKNIMFSGFAAAILAGMCGSADAATVLASKTYVDNQVKTRQAPLSAEDNSITIENVTDESGNVTGATIRANLPSLSGLATESYVQQEIEKIDIPTTEGLATTEQVEQGLATKQNVLTAGEGIDIVPGEGGTTTIKTNIDLSGLATKDEIANMVETSDIADMVVESDIANMATTGYVDEKTAGIATLNTDVAQLKTDVAGKQDELTSTNLIGGDNVDVDINAETGVITLSATDTNTTYETATATESGLTKLYDATGENTDGTMTQAAITSALGNKVDLSTYNQHITDQAAKDLAQDNAIDALVGSDGQTGSFTELQTTVTRLDGDAEVTGSVKQQVAAALAEAKQYADDSDADTIYDDTALAGRVTALEGAGYQNASQVEAAISDATIQMDKVDGLDTALAAKADASELNNYATLASVNALTGTDGAITKNTQEITALKNAGYQTAKDVEDKIEAGNFLSDTMEANGTYLVQQTASGVSYYAISIVDGDGNDIVTGQPPVE